MTPVCATTREGKAGQDYAKLDRFSYNRDQDRFACPHDHIFIFTHEHPTNGTRTYKSTEPVACTCGHYETADGREVIRVGQGHLAKRELQRIMDEPAHRELYRRRKCTAEPPFGQIKVGMGFRRFFYRGRQKVRSERNLVCAAFNLKKIGLKKIGVLRRARSEADPKQSTKANGATATASIPSLMTWHGAVATDRSIQKAPRLSLGPSCLRSQWPASLIAQAPSTNGRRDGPSKADSSHYELKTPTVRGPLRYRWSAGNAGVSWPWAERGTPLGPRHRSSLDWVISTSL